MTATSAVALTTTRAIPVELIDVADNDRKLFDSDQLRELAASIEANGLVQPPTVRPMGARFEIVAGERRIRAMRDVLGYSAIECQVRELDDAQASAVMLIENLQRVDLDPIEEATGYQKRVDLGASIADVVDVAKVPASRVRSRLQLLKLCLMAREAVSLKLLPLTFAAHLVDLDPDRQRLALSAYQATPMSADAFALVCLRLAQEQNADPLFDADSFFQVEEYALTAVAEADAQRQLELGGPDPVGAKDIAQRLGVKAATVATWRYRGIMPNPDWTVAGAPVWNWPTIVQWHESRGY